MTNPVIPSSQAQALLARGLQHLERQQLDAAAAAFQQALMLRRDFWQAHANLGLVLKAQGRFDEAIAQFRKAIKLAPPSAELLGSLANVFHMAGKAREAVQHYEQAIARDGRVPGIRMAFGALLMQLGRPDDAARQFTAVVELRPGHPWPQTLLGQALLNAGQREAGLGWLGQAVAGPTPPPEALHCMAGALLEVRQPDAAEAFSRRLVEHHPGFRGAWRQFGHIALTQGRVDEARAAFLREGDATAATRALLCLPTIPQDRAEIAAARAALAEGLAAGPAETLDLAAVAGLPTTFLLSYHGEDNLALQRALAGYYRRLCPALSFTAPHVGRPRPGKRRRIGFVSENFHDHTIGRLFAEVIAGLPRDRFEVVLIAPRRADDPVRRSLVRAADRVVPLERDLALARQRIAEQALDVLYYTDIGMGSLTYFLAFARLAPVQCVSWGHPETTGIDTMDVFVSCAAMEPEGAQAFYSERLAALPGSTVRYARPHLPDDRRKARAALGLPEERTLYVCPQTLFKLHPDFDAVLAAILRRDSDGVLVLISDIAAAVDEALRRRLVAAGVDGGRLVFVARQDHDGFLSLLAAADVMLDPLHYSGGNTSLEAFSFGTPIVTLPGRFMRARHTFGFYRLMGLDDCVAATPEEYVEIALKLGRDPARRAETRRRIIAANAVLYDDADASTVLASFLDGV